MTNGIDRIKTEECPQCGISCDVPANHFGRLLVAAFYAQHGERCKSRPKRAALNERQQG